eukprot:NODE_2517_length_421_cov_40.110215_g2436_i0.p2 GENE.NODE_2517_length_421_cov_40.110215_g2436_i0~~NODE_2517_length_421_cov_40.110215_g2436_i0.p2  ORF type:complete len:76 (+),score=12.32 NODE_2517_length_421_cov_40.110215_g2436_i0:59-286(+)
MPITEKDSKIPELHRCSIMLGSQCVSETHNDAVCPAGWTEGVCNAPGWTQVVAGGESGGAKWIEQGNIALWSPPP